MNFLSITQKVNLHVGLQGSVISVDASNYQEYLAEAVRSSWIDIQNMRENWKFMWDTVTFPTEIGTHEYLDSSIMLGKGYEVAKWKTDSIFMGGDKLKEITFQEYRDKEEYFNAGTDNHVFAVKEYPPASLIIPNPTAVEDIQADFYRTPQVLTLNTDVPLLPEEFHYYIVWKALEDVAAYLGNRSIYERHSWKADIIENKLMRSQVPAQKLKKKPLYRGNTGFPGVTRRRG